MWENGVYTQIRDTHVQEWGAGRPVIALHPFGLDSSAFSGIGRELAGWNLHTIAIDLPGFGRTPAPDAPLTAATLAEPVVEIAQTFDEPPVVIGISMGGRVALEAALAAPGVFRSVLAIQPYLPWLRYRWALPFARYMNPDRVERFPIEIAWPLLKRIADSFDESSWFKDDAVARSGKRIVYNMSCPATRRAIVSAAREMALEPASGPDSIWDRLTEIAVSLTFIWGARDRLVPASYGRHVAGVKPEARQIVLPCLAHAINGAHHRCLSNAVVSVLVRAEAGSAGVGECVNESVGPAAVVTAPCSVHG